MDRRNLTAAHREASAKRSYEAIDVLRREGDYLGFGEGMEESFDTLVDRITEAAEQKDA